MKKSKKVKKVSKSARIRELLAQGKSQAEIVKSLKVSPQLVYAVAKQKPKLNSIVHVRGRVLINDLFQMRKAINEVERKPTKLFVQPQYKDAAMKILADNDLVNHPPHYKEGGIDYWDFAEAKGLTENAYLFNAGKYIVRCGKKEGADPIQDLEKAIKFIQRDIDRRKKA